MDEFAKEVHFDEKVLGNTNTGDKPLIGLFNSLAIMAGSPKESKTNFISSNPNELCDRLNLLLQEKQAGNKSDIINEQFVAIADKLLEYKCISLNNTDFYYFIV